MQVMTIIACYPSCAEQPHQSGTKLRELVPHGQWEPLGGIHATYDTYLLGHASRRPPRKPLALPSFPAPFLPHFAVPVIRERRRPLCRYAMRWCTE